MRNMQFLFILMAVTLGVQAQENVGDTAMPVRSETISPIYKKSFTNDTCIIKSLGGGAQSVNGYQVFTGATDGNRQIDPQIAVGGGYIFHGTNTGLYLYTKDGKFVSGVSQKCFNNGIDPKMFFDIHHRRFVFNLWWYYDKEKTKPANIAVSANDDPLGAWNIYPVPLPDGKDGGGIGYSNKWIGYSFPGGENQTFIMRSDDAYSGKPARVYHFKGSLGHPVLGQDNIDALYFFEIERKDFVIRKIVTNANDDPYAIVVARKPHNLQHINYPPQSKQKGSESKLSSGDRNPKVIALQNNALWFAHTVNIDGRSAVQWHQLDANTAQILQTGAIRHATSNYIQSTLAVNRKEDVLIGFQQCDSNMYVSPRFALHRHNQAKGITGEVINAGEGKTTIEGNSGPWGDYSGSMIDGDNFSDLWTVQSIANENNRGSAVIIKVPPGKSRKNKKRK